MSAGNESVVGEIQGYAVSPQQRRLWQHQRQGSGFVAEIRVAIDGPLDAARLTDAIARVAARHESLRTTFLVPPGMKMPVQVVGSDSQLQVQLARPSESAATLVLTLPAICGDAWTLRNVVREVIAFYGASQERPVGDGAVRGVVADEMSSGTTAAAEVAEEPIQYAQFAEWQQELLASPQASPGRAYWRERLAPAPTSSAASASASAGAADVGSPRLPFEGRGAGDDRFEPAWLSAALGAGTVARVEDLAGRQGVTREAVFFAAWQLLLWRLTRQPSVEAYVEADGREYDELHDACGAFARLLPVRMEMAGDVTFAALLAAAHERVRENYEWQLYFAAPDPAGPLDPAALPCLFACHALPAAVQQGGARFRVTRLRVCDEPFKLRLAVACGPDDGEVTLGYDASRIAAADAAVLAEQYRALLDAALQAPETRVDRLSISSQEHRARLRATRESPVAPPPAELIATFEQQAAANPGAVAILCGDARLTYGELNARASQLAAFLRDRGVGPETRVALCFERSLDMLVSIVAVLKAGGAYVPLDPSHPADRLRWMLEETAAPILLTHAAAASVVAALETAGTTSSALSGVSPDASPIVVDLDRDAGAIAAPASGQAPLSAPAASSARPAQADDAAYVIYTSGSTGQPKGVVVTRGNVARLFQQTEGWYQFGKADVWSMCHNYAFDVSVWEMWGAWLHGGRLVVASRLDTRAPAQLHALLARERVTILSQTPSAFRQLAPEIAAEAARGEAPSLSLRAIVFAGEPLDPAMVRGCLARYPDAAIVNMYGITETTVHSTYKRIAVDDACQPERSPIGVPFADLRAYLLREDDSEAGFWETGELYLAGAGLARGYLRRPDLTAERFLPEIDGTMPGARMYRSGDLARRWPDGALEYVGRRDHQVKIRGYRVELGEIEAVLRRQPGVRESSVRLKGTGGDSRLVAYVFPTADHTLDVDSLRATLQSTLPDYMVPAAIVALDEMPLTANGKLDTRALPEPDQQRPAPRHTYVPAGTDAERMLARIWGEVLGLEQVGVEDNFFDIGGHSLLMIQVHGRLQDALGRDLSILDLFARPTIKRLAELVAGDPAPTAPAADTDDASAREARAEERRETTRRRRAARTSTRVE